MGLRTGGPGQLAPPQFANCEPNGLEVGTSCEVTGEIARTSAPILTKKGR
jgi:hypothetical protein